MSGPEAALLHLLLERADDAHECVVVRVDDLEREDLLLDEVAHPAQLLFEFGFGRKIPGHCVMPPWLRRAGGARSEEHTSELQSRSDLVCRLLLEKKKKTSGPARSSSRGATRRGDRCRAPRTR